MHCLLLADFQCVYSTFFLALGGVANEAASGSAILAAVNMHLPSTIRHFYPLASKPMPDTQ